MDQMDEDSFNPCVNIDQEMLRLLEGESKSQAKGTNYKVVFSNIVETYQKSDLKGMDEQINQFLAFSQVFVIEQYIELFGNNFVEIMSEILVNCEGSLFSNSLLIAKNAVETIVSSKIEEDFSNLLAPFMSESIVLKLAKKVNQLTSFPEIDSISKFIHSFALFSQSFRDLFITFITIENLTSLFTQCKQENQGKLLLIIESYCAYLLSDEDLLLLIDFVCINLRKSLSLDIMGRLVSVANIVFDYNANIVLQSEIEKIIETLLPNISQNHLKPFLQFFCRYIEGSNDATLSPLNFLVSLLPNEQIVLSQLSCQVIIQYVRVANDNLNFFNNQGLMEQIIKIVDSGSYKNQVAVIGLLYELIEFGGVPFIILICRSQSQNSVYFLEKIICFISTEAIELCNNTLNLFITIFNSPIPMDAIHFVMELFIDGNGIENCQEASELLPSEAHDDSTINQIHQKAINLLSIIDVLKHMDFQNARDLNWQQLGDDALSYSFNHANEEDPICIGDSTDNSEYGYDSSTEEENTDEEYAQSIKEIEIEESLKQEELEKQKEIQELEVLKSQLW